MNVTGLFGVATFLLGMAWMKILQQMIQTPTKPENAEKAKTQ